VPAWTNIEEVHLAYMRVCGRYPVLRGHVEEIGKSLAQAIVDEFNVLGRRQPDESMGAISKEGDLSRAIIGCPDANRDLFAIRVFPATGQSYMADAHVVQSPTLTISAL